MSACSEEQGAATVLVLAAVLAVLAVGAVAVVAGEAVQLRHRGAVAADAAAVAAALRASEGAGPACATAAAVARADDARMSSCGVRGSVAEVVVEAGFGGWLGWLAPARLNARAGPAETYQDEPAPLDAPS